MSGPVRIPLHRSVIGRLLATSLLIAVAAVAATAWLAVQSTSRAIRQEQGRSLADDKSVYDMLVAYAATHRDWSGVQGLIQDRSATLGRRITLTNEDREVLADAGGTGPLTTVRPSATVDPLRLDPALTGSDDRIDARAVGPYRLPRSEKEELRRSAESQLACMRHAAVDARVADDPSGRPTVQLTGPDPHGVVPLCRAKTVALTATEKRALEELTQLASRCLGLAARTKLVISRDFSVDQLSLAPADRPRDVSNQRLQDCIQDTRVRQLQPYVAPPALLFITDPASPADAPVFTLTWVSALRMAGVTGGVLLVTVVLTVLVGRRLVRPLRVLTEAAAQPAQWPARLPIARDDELGYLARALHEMAERREQAEAQRRQMVGDIAHELRNPLTNIQGWLEAMQDGVVQDRAAVLELLHDEAATLRHIVEDLADLAAVDSGSLRLHREPVHLKDVVEQVCDSHRSLAAKAGLTVLCVVRGDPMADADPVRLRQIVGNLVSNAIRYTPRGGTVTVTLTATRSDAHVVMVEDSGIGIDADDLPRIFDRFWRADTSRTRATGGSGLGLPIARHLTEAHGGTLTAESQPGQGTTVTLRLPVTP